MVVKMKLLVNIILFSIILLTGCVNKIYWKKFTLSNKESLTINKTEIKIDFDFRDNIPLNTHDKINYPLHIYLYTPSYLLVNKDVYIDSVYYIIENEDNKNYIELRDVGTHRWQNLLVRQYDNYLIYIPYQIKNIKLGFQLYEVSNNQLIFKKNLFYYLQSKEGVDWLDWNL